MMQQEEMILYAKRLGFAGMWGMPVADFCDVEEARRKGCLHQNARALQTDPKNTYPWAQSMILCIYPYRPYRDHLPGYYEASNSGYHAFKEFIRALNDNGVRAEHTELPVAALARRLGIGQAILSGLTSFGEWGTRVAAYTAVLECTCNGLTDAPIKDQMCQGCDACVRACPTGAIDGQGFHWQRCIRAYLDGQPMPEWVMRALPGMLGCEICQQVCPRNRHIPVQTEDAHIRGAVALDRLLKGQQQEAKLLLGKNMASHGRFYAQAAVLAAKEGKREHLPYIKKLSDHKEACVRRAADWAICRLE